MAFNNLYKSSYFGSSPPGGGGGYQSAYSSPYGQNQPTSGGHPVAPITFFLYNAQAQPGAMARLTPTKTSALGSISSSPQNVPSSQGHSDIMGPPIPPITPNKLNPPYNNQYQSMIGSSPLTQAAMKSPSPTKPQGQSKLDTDPFASILNAPYPLGQRIFNSNVTPAAGQSTGVSIGVGYMGKASAAMIMDYSMDFGSAERENPFDIRDTMEHSREIKIEASKTDPSRGFGWIEIGTPQESMPVAPSLSSLGPAVHGNTQSAAPLNHTPANHAPVNPCYVAPQLNAPNPSGLSRAHAQGTITGEALREAYRAINYLSKLGDIARTDCSTYSAIVQVPDWVSNAEVFKAALVVPFEHAFHGEGAGIVVDPSDIELGIWENFTDKVDLHFSERCACFDRYNDWFNITYSRKPFEDDVRPKHCAFCMLDAHLHKARRFINSLDSVIDIPEAPVLPSAVDLNLLSQAGPPQNVPSRAGQYQAGISQGEQSQAGPSRAGSYQTGLSQARPSQEVPSRAGQYRAAPSQLQAGPPETYDLKALKRETWYWIESAKVSAFLYGQSPLSQAQEIAVNWKASSDFVGPLNEMAGTLLRAVDDMWFHLYMGILVPLCHRWTQFQSFRKFSVTNANERRKFWHLRMIEEPDWVEKWLECLDVLVNTKTFAKKHRTDTPWNTSVKSSLKTWTERLFLVSMDLVFREIVFYTHLQSHEPNFIKDTKDKDSVNYDLLRSQHYKITALYSDADVKPFAVDIQHWPLHHPTLTSGRAAHLKASQIISVSCNGRRRSM
ncbi:uncharacterized protein PAC_10516 [Phialocephala subalpina]|uniref:Uncharacterized protein n=1 Tax=Phialocephala subalpina TaxID=576137 RepID=A0A1L7X6H0_9HELO|nr:uncharacterized protein PAC_10516 [Phialocephala subalpina]